MCQQVYSEITALRGPVPLSHLLLVQYVRMGDVVVDATCGNGNDTLLLARLVGAHGRVWAFDIQEQALRITAEKLRQAGFAERVDLVREGHENMAHHVGSGIAAVVFNLGYLPNGDRTIITNQETTVSACKQAAELLKAGGIMAMTLYPGHEGGKVEKQAVELWAHELSPRQFHLWQMQQINVAADAPSLILLQKAL